MSALEFVALGSVVWAAIALAETVRRAWRRGTPGVLASPAGSEWRGVAYAFGRGMDPRAKESFIRDGRIRMDPARVPQLVTLHDPCNLVRVGGVIEPQRQILTRAVARWVEMTPSGVQNFCCGGGGGQLSMTRFARRLEAGRVKADQIRATGARIVATPCHNCIDQLSELNKEYKLGVEVKTVCEIVAASLVHPA